MQQESLVEKKVYEFLTRYELFGKTFVVGFSGGFDSMCLLEVLSHFDIKLVAAHYNHGWRIEADEEETRCRAFCESFGIEFYAERASRDLPQTENDARIARYDFFDRVVGLYGADGVFTAHNFDDNAETVLYRIIKGTGVKGLQGISECRGNIYRPILSCTRAEIEKYCAAKGLIPNVDSSNADIKYKRNFLRHKILPLMEEINPLAKNSINNLSELARLNELIVAEYLNGLVGRVLLDNEIDIKEFVNLSTPVQQRVVYEFLSDKLPEYDSKKVKEVLDFILANCENKSDVKMSLTTDLWIVVNNQKALLYSLQNKNSDEVYVSGEGQYLLGEWILKVEKCENLPEMFPKDNEGVAFVDLSQVEFPFALREGCSDDLITPLGMKGSMVLKKYLSGRGIMKVLRGSVPVLAKDKEVLWVPNIGLSETVRVGLKPTHKLKFERK